MGSSRTIFYFVLLTLVLAGFWTIPVSAQGPTPTDDEVNRIAKQLYCPVCESTPLDVCPTEACRQWRDLIRSMLAEGRSEEEIEQYFVEHYGARVLAEPPNRLATYLVPAVAILLGAFMLFRGFRMWMKPSITEAGAADAPPEPEQDPYIAKLEEELRKQK
ncbi:MAG: cytochrome c-type biogenesis protein CcmH [Anaerolineales bacterium]|nr:cytochrome c-type biogenesis protein CcmH [Anaerolineales bacterium]